MLQYIVYNCGYMWSYISAWNHTYAILGRGADQNWPKVRPHNDAAACFGAWSSQRIDRKLKGKVLFASVMFKPNHINISWYTLITLGNGCLLAFFSKLSVLCRSPSSTIYRSLMFFVCTVRPLSCCPGSNLFLNAVKNNTHWRQVLQLATASQLRNSATLRAVNVALASKLRSKETSRDVKTMMGLEALYRFTVHTSLQWIHLSSFPSDMVQLLHSIPCQLSRCPNIETCPYNTCRCVRALQSQVALKLFHDLKTKAGALHLHQSLAIGGSGRHL